LLVSNVTVISSLGSGALILASLRQRVLDGALDWDRRSRLVRRRRKERIVKMN
jgi:hypothetical protein